MQFFKYSVVLTPDEEEPSAYNVTVPAFSEIATCGDSLEEARFMAQDALELVILSRLEEGEEIPLDKKPTRIKKERFVTVPFHQAKTIPVGTLRSIIRQSGIPHKEFLSRGKLKPSGKP